MRSTAPAPSRPSKCGLSFFQIASEMACRLCPAVAYNYSLVAEDKRKIPQNQNLDNLVTTLSKLWWGNYTSYNDY